MSPRRPITPVIMSEFVRVATYNVHRWQSANGRSKPDVERAGYVISEFEADVIALQEVLRPYDEDAAHEEDPLGQRCTTELPGGKKIKGVTQDKGQEQALRATIETVKSGALSPIPLDEIIQVSRATLAIEDSIRSGAAETVGV